MSQHSDLIFAYVTTKDRAEATKIGRTLVERRLAACVNILDGMTSLYRWQGKIEAADEAVLIIKTRQSALDAVTALIKELHSYEVPCVVALPLIEGGNRDYIEWLMGEL